MFVNVIVDSGASCGGDSCQTGLVTRFAPIRSWHGSSYWCGTLWIVREGVGVLWSKFSKIGSDEILSEISTVWARW